MEKFEGVSQRLQLATRWSFKVRVIYEEIILFLLLIKLKISFSLFQGFLEFKDIEHRKCCSLFKCLYARF